MSDWNDIAFDRDGLPRGYAIVDDFPGPYEPVAPPSWVRITPGLGESDAEIIAKAVEHAAIVGREDPMDVRVLAKRYEIVHARCHALPPQSCTTITPSPIDAFAVPVAIAAKVRVVGTSARAESRIIGIAIRGCQQEDWLRSHLPYMQRPYLSTMDIDRGRAWPVTWGCFTNQAIGSALLCLEVWNPSHEHTVDIELFLFCVTYNRCPVEPRKLGHRLLCPPIPIPPRSPFDR